jgi:hypothetical protein
VSTPASIIDEGRICGRAFASYRWNVTYVVYIVHEQRGRVSLGKGEIVAWREGREERRGKRPAGENKEIRCGVLKAPADAPEVGVVGEGTAVKTCRAPEAVLRIDERVDALPELRQAGESEVVGGVKGVSEEVAVEARVVQPEVVQPVPIRRTANVTVRSCLKQARRPLHKRPVGRIQVLQGVVVEVLKELVDGIQRVRAR